MAQMTQQTVTPPLGAVIKDGNGISVAWRYANLAANGTTEVKATAGILHSITINTKGATANTCTVFDSITGSGTMIATIDTTANVQTLIFDVVFSTALTIVIGSGTAANITVSYV